MTYGNGELPNGGWIPVSERLPDKVGTYMTTVDYDQYGIAVGQRYYHGKGIGWEDDCVIAWMPLPEPYKPQESEGKNDRERKKNNDEPCRHHQRRNQ